MLIRIPNVLAPSEAAEICQLLDGADWKDGRQTAGYLSQQVKQNHQLREDHPLCIRLGQRILDALDADQMFLSAALPLKVVPPLFNRYGAGMGFGDHIDSAIRSYKGTDFPIRTDLSATLFLAEPETYDGGELVIEDTFGVHEVKLAAGDLILYPASSLHRVTPVTRGMRIASFFWVQSLIRSDAQRTLLYDMDLSIRALTQKLGPADPQVISLTGGYHNLLRMWAEP